MDDPIANFLTAILLRRSQTTPQRGMPLINPTTPQPIFRSDGASGRAGASGILPMPGMMGQSPSVYRPLTTPRRGL